MLKEFYGTFGTDQPNAYHYVKIYAISYEQAVDLMCEYFNKQWWAVHENIELIHSADRHALTNSIYPCEE